MGGEQRKFLMLSPIGWKKVWFIVPKTGLVTVDWTFTGLKQNLSRASARVLWQGLNAMGWRRII